MMRRMSKRLAIRAARISSSSVAPVEGVCGPRNGCCCSVMAALLLDEDDVQDHDEPEGHAAQQPHRAVPGVVGWVVLRGRLLLARQPPYEATQLLVGFRLRDQRDADGHGSVGHEGDD